jgi:hypothetical protein
MGASHRARHRSRWFQVMPHQNLTPFTSVLNRDIGSEPFELLQLRKIEAHAREGWRKRARPLKRSLAEAPSSCKAVQALHWRTVRAKIWMLGDQLVQEAAQGRVQFWRYRDRYELPTALSRLTRRHRRGRQFPSCEPTEMNHLASDSLHEPFPCPIQSMPHSRGNGYC